MKIRPMGVAHAERRTDEQRDGQTDGWTDLNLVAAFCNYVKEPKKVFCSSEHHSNK
jgi:hypothetical protein